MGCELVVPKYHVEFDVETNEEWSEGSTCFHLDNGYKGYDLWIPNTATITEIKPEFEAGWYQDLDEGDEYLHVAYWDLDEIESYGTDYRGRTFGERMVRMNPPTPYEEAE